MNQTSTLQILKSETFGTVKCDFYGDGNQVYMTREQIGTALEYANPQRQSEICIMHIKNAWKSSRSSNRGMGETSIFTTEKALWKSADGVNRKKLMLLSKAA